MPDSSPDQLVQELCDALEATAPANFSRATLRVWASILTYQLEVSVTMPDGSSTTVEMPPVTEKLARLRWQMYQPGRGTWFSAWFDLRTGEPPKAGFNYDKDPGWWPEVPATLFARDLESFPRAAEHIPGWLQQKLDEAATLEEQTPPDARSNQPQH
jgi:hypothetical protein